MTIETYAEVWSYGPLQNRFATIDYANAIEGYEWDEIHVLRGVDGGLYIGQGSGCSCNSFNDDGVEEGFVQVSSWQEAANHIREWFSEYDYREVVGMSLIERLTTSQPKAYLPQPFGGAAS